MKVLASLYCICVVLFGCYLLEVYSFQRRKWGRDGSGLEGRYVRGARRSGERGNWLERVVREKNLLSIIKKNNLKECFPQVILRCFNLTVITNPHGRLGKLWESFRSCGCNYRLCSGFLSVLSVLNSMWNNSHINHRFPGSYLLLCFFVSFTSILYTACFLMISFLVHITECI